MNCDYVAEGKTAEETVSKAMQHMEEDHEDRLSEMKDSMSDGEIKDMMMSNVQGGD